MNEESALIACAKAGDERAFEALVTAYEKKVYATAYRFLGNEADAMDASQEVFLRVFRFLDKFNEASSFSTWLYRITINVCKDSHKKRAARGELSLEVPDDENGSYSAEISDSRYDPVEVFEQAELSRNIREGIESLPENYKEMIVMRDLCDMSYEQIAADTGLEIGTVKSRISRARERLRKYLLQNGNKPSSFRSK